ncbi:MAG: dihydrolipoyl dehydrogenase [Prevotella sp.]|nr:dihydrolipoyl dehydrogenase [Prevotella sp.]
MTYDLIIIGAGPGGYHAADYAARNGLSVLIVESNHVGGTCLNEGCIPTKALCRNAEVAELLNDSSTFGLHHEGLSLDFSAVMQRKDEVVSQLRKGVETILSHPSIQLVRGTASFVADDPHTIEVTTEEGAQRFSAANIIIATGSEPRLIPVPGIDQPHVLTSTALLNIGQLPKSLAIVGAGVIGMEMASVFASLGTMVSVIEFLPECLPMLDAEVARRLRQTLSRRLSIDFFMQSSVTAIEGNVVRALKKGKPLEVEADYVLVATGRSPRLEGLHLDRLPLEVTRSGIVTDENMQTSVEGIYAIGDVNGRTMLAHAASMQARRAVNHILKRSDTIRLDVMPAAIFTHPEAACVGVTEEQAGEGFECRKVHYRANGKALADHQTDGLLKLICGPDRRIAGCHVCGSHAADIVQLVAALMCLDATVDQLADITHIHPTVTEILQEAACAFL